MKKTLSYRGIGACRMAWRGAPRMLRSSGFFFPIAAMNPAEKTSKKQMKTQAFNQSWNPADTQSKTATNITSTNSRIILLTPYLFMDSEESVYIDTSHPPLARIFRGLFLAKWRKKATSLSHVVFVFVPKLVNEHRFFPRNTSHHEHHQ